MLRITTARVTALVFALSPLLGACAPTRAFPCSADEQCVDGAARGLCEAEGYCSFPDDTCPSGRRFGAFANEGLASACVDGDSITTTTTATSATTDATTDATTGGACVDQGGLCGDSSECCGSCVACEGGTCQPAAAGAPCVVDCATLVWGDQLQEESVTCYRMAEGTAAGECAPDGSCALPDATLCSGPGAPLLTCSQRCHLSPSGCVAGASADTIEISDLCATDAVTPLCRPTCDPDGLDRLDAACDAVGACIEDLSTCAPYLCADGECTSSCVNTKDCAPDATCTMKICS
ncbi:MAG: hypothetical protein IPK80_30985 [Nannocystis sp.]|nr:hypothetical protein [Nannocystis sp.]